MKQKGVITEGTHTLIRELVANGVTPQHIDPIIKLVTCTYGVEISGSIDARSVRRIILEGGVADDLHVVENIRDAAGRYFLLSFYCINNPILIIRSYIQH